MTNQIEAPYADAEGVRATVARIAHYIDAKRWADLRALYADEVDVDYTSLFGGSPRRQRGDDLVGGWQKALGEVTTQHLFGPVDVALDGAAATAECHVCANHHAPGARGGDEWVVYGHYRIALAKQGAGWRIVAMALDTIRQSGNAKLLEEASK